MILRPRRQRGKGFTLIEILIFIVVTSLLMSTMMLGAFQALRKSPDAHQQWVALETIKECVEWYLDQRRLNGYSVLSCPSTPTASACSAPTGYTISTSIACTTWNSDTAFKTITVSASGLATASLSVQIGDY